MNDTDLLCRILEVYKHCRVQSFPIDCFKILDIYGYQCIPYSSQSKAKKDYCYMVSPDAFQLKEHIFYNDTMPDYRIRFSLMHELGHIILESNDEKSADRFASHILAPSMAIHYARCKTPEDVSRLFVMSLEASSYALQRYHFWLMHVQKHKMSPLDNTFYGHFYNEQEKRFVYKIKECNMCFHTYTNRDTCPQCEKYLRQQIRKNHYSSLDNDLMAAEEQWLYGWL